MNRNECPLCFHQYNDLQELQLHVIECRQLNKKKIHRCQYCKETFSRKYCLDRHLEKNRCKMVGEWNQSKPKLQIKKKISPSLSKLEKLEKQLAEKEKEIAELKCHPVRNETIERLEKMEKRLDEKDSEIAELKENPRINNQILQVVCVGSNDNYLDMLTHEVGFDQALDYIKDCALSSLIGDCKLIEKIYFGGSCSVLVSEKNPNELRFPYSIRFQDKNRTKIEYFNEKREKIADSREIFGRKIANNLQNSYLKGVNYLITQNLEDHKCPNKFNFLKKSYVKKGLWGTVSPNFWKNMTCRFGINIFMIYQMFDIKEE